MKGRTQAINLLDALIVVNALQTDLISELTCRHMQHLKITSAENVINHLH